MVNVGLLLIAAFLVLVVLGTPVYIALSAPAFVYIVWEGIPIVLIAQRWTHTMNSFTLLAIPLFIYVGCLMNHSGVSDYIFDFSNDVIGHVKGGTAQVNILASLIFSGMSGSQLADVGGIGRILIERMNAEGYKKAYSSAITSVSATIGPLFPPSVPLIVYGILARESVLALLLAGIGPALILFVLLVVVTYIHAKHRDFPAGERSSKREISESFVTALPALVAPVILVGGMLLGIFGPTEAAAVTILYIFVILTIAYGRYRSVFTTAGNASLEAARTTTVVMIIVAGAEVFSWIIAIERTPRYLADILMAGSPNVTVLLIIANVFLLILGLFLTPITAMVMAIPLLVPPLVEAGVHPVHIGTIMVFNLMIGNITPPFGVILFVASDIADASVAAVIRELLPYYLVLLVCLMIVTFVPEISLWIPQAVM